MAIVNGYTTAAALSDRVAGGQSVNAVNAEALDRAIEAASRGIDHACERFFYDSGTASAKTFRVVSGQRTDLLRVPDFHTVTGLAVATDDDHDGVYETTWTIGTDFAVEPLDPKPGWPWNRLVGFDTRSFPRHQARALVRVTAKWGWAAVPTDIVEACLIAAAELFKLKDAPFGVAGFDNFGAVRVRSNPRVSEMIQPYIRVDG